MKVERCTIRSVDGLNKDLQSCCEYPQDYIGYVTKPFFSAKYCQTCHTITLNEKKWINTIWLLIYRPFWRKKKEFHWNHREGM